MERVKRRYYFNEKHFGTLCTSMLAFVSLGCHYENMSRLLIILKERAIVNNLI